MTDKMAPLVKLAGEIAEDMSRWALVYKVGGVRRMDGQARFTVMLRDGDVFEVKVGRAQRWWKR